MTDIRPAAAGDFETVAGLIIARLRHVALSDPTLAFGPPQGETGRDFHARVQRWLEHLPETGEVVAFTLAPLSPCSTGR